MGEAGTFVRRIEGTLIAGEMAGNE